MGCRILRINAGLLGMFLQRGFPAARIVSNPLPADSRIVDVQMDSNGRDILLTIGSVEFPDDDPMAELPAPMFQEIH